MNNKILRTNPETNTRACYFIVLLGALLLYTITCAPGAVWQDSGMIQYRVWHNDLVGKLGLALSHPLFYILAIGAKFIPAGEFGFRVNMVSAVAAAIAVANLYLLVKLCTGKDIPALVAAVSLALSHTFWRHATICETYDLYTALLLGELIMLLCYRQSRRIRYLYLMGLLNGLSISTHMLGVIALFVYVIIILILLIRKDIRLRQMCVIVLLWTAGAAPYLFLVVRELVQSGDLRATLASAAFGAHWQKAVLNSRITGQIVKENLMFWGLNFPTPNIILFFVGFWFMLWKNRDKTFGVIVAVLTGLYLGFAFRYTVPDRYAFFIPFYALTGAIIGIGAYGLLQRHDSAILAGIILFCCLWPIGAYWVAPAAAKKLYPALGQRRQIPYRDNYKYFLRPWRGNYRGAERFGREALISMDKGGIIWADNTTVYPLLYVQEVLGEGKDKYIVSTWAGSKNAPVMNESSIKELMAHRAVYVVSTDKGYCPQYLRERFAFKADNCIWRVVPK